ncbi:hypothetical protein Pla123a_22790 [Posidoniimonas polymericola]|uniref:DUF362 domain-containing protein n=1 Tax=Posidoniimonas polymericola TaxID=2528002 RepID=A0A5C5YPM6_9BACT|nr:DUF362 domain-containing protein [Posidoniimonas polymericola]TWT76856.1 hypothetical protein Pla123a_22790 [Posidoniimonas polymericola]
MSAHDKSLIDRRSLLGLGGLAAAGLVAVPAIEKMRKSQSPVFIAKGKTYQSDLAATIRDGLLACDVQAGSFKGKRVLLKPNLVEPTRKSPHMTTHPAMIVAAAEVFRGWGAEVSVGEAPGHVRDTEMALVESGVGEALSDGGLKFADLNYEEVGWRRNRGKYSGLKGIYLPRSVLEADVVVSMPKMKTHHWVGVTCGMKNMYGVMPGIKYGWPKNVLHHNGIPQTVADINATMTRTMTIVDGIDCMEGDGPILGTMKHMGLVVVGANLPAVDATVARIMGLDPTKIEYLQLASHYLGAIDDDYLVQRGENWRELVSPFHILDESHLQKLRATPEGDLVS